MSSPTKTKAPNTPIKGHGATGVLQTNSGQRLRPQMSRSEVSDSEEERQRRIKLRRAALSTVDQNGLRVVVISSDEEDEEDIASVSVVAQDGSQQTQPSGTGLFREADDAHDSDSEAELPLCTPRRKPGSNARRRNVVLSDSESDEDQEKANPEQDTVHTPRKNRLPLNPDDEIIDLTLSSSESEHSESEGRARTRTADDTAAEAEPVLANSQPSSSQRPAPKAADTMLPLFLDGPESDDETVPDDPFSYDGGAILILNEPRSAQKPVRRTVSADPADDGPPTPLHTLAKKLSIQSPAPDPGSDSEGEVAAAIQPKPVVARVKSSVASPRPNKPGTAKAPRMTKKALLQLELQRRKAYAETFFRELNESVFEGGIPEETKLEWNKRLLTTAGRAHWHRSRDGTHTTSIQLAEKILDCDERIRNTLSHEMCHLACWIIDAAPDENHGSLFKRWAQKVMRKRPEIEVTTKHNYDIKCKYEWKCANCAKIYGRHSKSINPEEYVCGVCKVGQLVPQFESRRAPKTPKPKAADSQNAAARSRDSPLHMPGAFPSPIPAKTGAATASARTHTLIELSDDDDSDVELLAQTLKSVQI